MGNFSEFQMLPKKTKNGITVSISEACLCKNIQILPHIPQTIQFFPHQFYFLNRFKGIMQQVLRESRNIPRMEMYFYSILLNKHKLFTQMSWSFKFHTRNATKVNGTTHMKLKASAH